MKKFFSILICIITVLFSLTSAEVSAYEPTEEIKGKIAYLVTADDSATVLYSKGASKKTQPCSLTKIMTAAIALEKYENPDKVTVTAAYNAVHYLDGSYCTIYGIEPNDKYSLLDLIYLMMLGSANDAATVIADFAGDGSITEFISLMNAKAKKLGCKNTNFENPTGIDEDNQYTTAEDMSKIVRYAMTLPVFSTVAKTSSYDIKKNSTHSAATVVNDNPLLPSDSYGDYFAYDYCTGVKTGYTIDSGYCTAATATKDGTSYIAITFEGEMKMYDGLQRNSSLVDTIRLFRWAFTNFKIKEICSSNTVVATVKVNLSKDTDYVGLVPKESITSLVPINVDTSTLVIRPVDLPKSVNAPVKAGDYVCKAQIIHADEVIQTIDLVAYEGAKVSVISYIMHILKLVFTNWITITLLVLALVCAGVFAVYRYRNNVRRRKNKKRAMDKYNRARANSANKRYRDDLDRR